MTIQTSETSQTSEPGGAERPYEAGRSQASQRRPWTEQDVPDQSGRVFVVTGANSGLGLEAARVLAGRGAHVVMACRSEERAAQATEQIRRTHPEADLEVGQLDLASLDSVRAFAERCLERHPRIDVLCNNAGVMALPLCRTKEGFEMQLGTNHLGHFALTGRLLPALFATPGARIVTVSSGAHKIGRIRLDDLQSTRSYSKWGAYGQSKLANLLFTFELDRRLRASGAEARALACHPGYAATNLQTVGPRMSQSGFGVRLMEWANRTFAQSAAMGALPLLHAATSPEAEGGAYYGPDGFQEAWGHPRRVTSSARSHDRETAAALWERSCELTGVEYAELRG